MRDMDIVGGIPSTKSSSILDRKLSWQPLSRSGTSETLSDHAPSTCPCFDFALPSIPTMVALRTSLRARRE